MRINIYICQTNTIRKRCLRKPTWRGVWTHLVYKSKYKILTCVDLVKIRQSKKQMRRTQELISPSKVLLTKCHVIDQKILMRKKRNEFGKKF